MSDDIILPQRQVKYFLNSPPGLNDPEGFLNLYGQRFETPKFTPI